MSSVSGLLREAQTYHARGEFGGAVRAYDKILRLDRRNYDAAYFRAVALYQAGQLDLAAQGFAAAAAISPRRFEPHKDRGLTLMKLGRHAEALASFEAAIAIKPQAADMLVNKGIAQKNLGQVAESVESYRAALLIKPDFAEAHNNLANSLAVLGQTEQALASYQTARELKPGYAEAYINAAALLQKTERHAEAKAVLEPLLAAAPRNAAALRSLAISLYAMKETAGALDALGKAVAIDPRCAEAYVTRAEIFEREDREPDALDDYSRAVAAEPGNVDALLGKAQLLCNAARHDEAIALCDKAITLAPGNARAYERIGRAFEGKKDWTAAAISFNKACELDPQAVYPRLRKAAALGKLQNHQEALASCEEAIAIDPACAEAHARRGTALQELERLPEALSAYDAAIAHAPERTSYYEDRAVVQVLLGDSKAALIDFERAFAIIAGNDSAAQAAAARCAKLLSADKFPVVYASQSELEATRDGVEEILNDLMLVTEDGGLPGEQERRVAEHATQHLIGFYLAYHQRNDRETMRKLSLVTRRLLGIPPYQAEGQRSGPIRIGVASQRLNSHNGANWAYNWFAHLPSGDYEIFTYDFAKAKDSLSEKFAALGTHRDLVWSSDKPQEIVRQMRDDGLDFLMLTDVGMTPVSRYLSLHRIAPRQFTAWGHPVTTGSPEMDYYLSSDLMEPANGQDHYTETLVRMPNLALYLDENAYGTPEACRFSLPEGRVLYGCLQSLFKYVPRYDGILPRIAREVPEALFVFLEGSPAHTTEVMKQRLDRAFAAHGLDAARHVVFMKRLNSADFDRLVCAMDLCIDSVGWSGGNTTMRNIAFGVPLVTLPGEFMRGRHSYAMFRMIGAEELIASSVDDYVEKLVRLGQSPEERRAASELLLQKRHRLYRDQSFSAAFDTFLKSELRR
jgi:protein O-GlcNAc transferase